MNLKGNAQMRPKIKQISLVFNVQIENYSEAAAADGDHGSCFVVGFGYVGFKIVLIINLPNLFSLQIPFSLNQFSKHQIINGCRKQL